MLVTQPNKYTVSHRTIKYDHLFLVDNTNGEIPPDNDSGLGLYNLDTRFLSGFSIKLSKTEPLCLLSSTEVGYLSTLVYTNGQFETTTAEDESTVVLEETIQLKRETLLNEALYEKLILTSYNIEPVWIRLSFKFDADFRDMFEIRHLVPPKIREIQGPLFENGTLRFAYEGNGRSLETRILFKDFEPSFEDDHTIVVDTLIYPLEKKEFNLEIQTHSSLTSRECIIEPDYTTALRRVHTHNQVWEDTVTEFSSDNEDFNEMLERSQKDLRMLVTRTEDGMPFIAAGIPWYVCLFGRDSIITAQESLIFNPSIAKWTLFILARYQGTKVDPWRDEEPGKILHELRRGELASLGEVPHTPYYGSVDATPLWLTLLYDYYLWTKDLETVQALWPNALAALGWIEHNLSQSPFGYSTYKTTCPLGIIHQGWKDSHNSAMYENGLQAEPPIALAEVQGYVYLARQRMSELAEILGDTTLQHKLLQENKAFKEGFNKDFWMDETGFCALGLDSQGRQLRVVASNPGHCLETGIFTTAHARKVANRIMAPDMFNGWGIRTLSGDMLAYNPMSYHNGSIWPHDNAIIGRGLSMLDRNHDTERVFTGLFEAARQMTYKRLPELFCGFPRDITKSDPPVKYPVACSPQAWASATVYCFLQAMLNLSPELKNGTLHIRQPQLPSWMNLLRIRNFRIFDSVLDLEFKRAEKNVVVDVRSREGNVDIMMKI